ncbi:helix-turn-helix domain-containing protein [Saccharomonospora sp. NB11]|jgi:DNA-binding HxlR family transcriptional regulator|uniref:winged helix-turn-helix transcriptional regulator n=1 Tax=Saccharomonospora sp. NB11 TaxID=1642298 RepID=UPI0018D0F112|nr:helix-turn-helix domain-containing protein [Saccharomonospora sp. NB11]
MGGRRRYGQYCGLAHAVELVGERWTLLIVRDLLVGPKRFTELRRGLPRIPTNILSDRLKRLEADGLVRRRLLPRPASAVVYELTEYGHDLDEIVLALGRWGARTLGAPREDDVVTPDSIVTALRATFRPEAAVGLSLIVELHVTDVVVTARIDDGVLTTREGTATEVTGAEADAVVTVGPGLRALLAREITPEHALADGGLTVSGEPSAAEILGSVFVLEPTPAAALDALDSESETSTNSETALGRLRDRQHEPAPSVEGYPGV